MIRRKRIIIPLILIAIVIYLLSGEKNYKCEGEEVMQSQNNICINENEYEKQMRDKVLPLILQYEKSGYFKSDDDINLFYRKFELPKPFASIVIVHGFTENTHVYDELIYYMLEQNYSVYIYDQRCHGLSDRLTDTYNMVYVENFSDYTSDLKKFIDEIVPESKIFLYGHSMGGAVVADFLESYSDKINFAILSAPMLQILTKPYPPKVAALYSETENLIGAKKKYCPGYGDFEKETSLANPVYKEYPRYIYAINFAAHNPKIITSGASFAWFKQSTKAIKKILQPENMEKIKIPIAMFQYGQDKTVMPGGQNKFASFVPNCKLYTIKDSEHNIYYMHNDILNKYLNKVFELFDAH